MFKSWSILVCIEDYLHLGDEDGESDENSTDPGEGDPALASRKSVF